MTKIQHNILSTAGIFIEATEAFHDIHCTTLKSKISKISTVRLTSVAR